MYRFFGGMILAEILARHGPEIVHIGRDGLTCNDPPRFPRLQHRMNKSEAPKVSTPTAKDYSPFDVATKDLCKYAGSWSLNFETGELGWSEELSCLHGGIPGTPRYLTVEVTRSTLVSWAQAAALRAVRSTSIHPPHLDLDICDLQGGEHTLRFLCLPTAPGMPVTKLAGMVFEVLPRPMTAPHIRYSTTQMEKLNGFDSEPKLCEFPTTRTSDGGKEIQSPLQQTSDLTNIRSVTQALIVSQHFFRSAFDQNPLGFAITTDSAEIMDVNAALCKMFDYDREELIGRTFMDLSVPDDPYRHLAAVADLLDRSSRHTTFRKSYRRRDGSVLLGKVNVLVVEAGAGEGALKFVMIEDITDAEQTRNALNQSERLFREAFEFGPIGAAIVDAKGRYLEVNNAYANLLGYAKEELLGRSSRDFTMEGNFHVDIVSIGPLLRKSNGRLTRYKKYVHRNGSIVEVRLDLSTISGDLLHPDDSIRFLVFIQDQTELRQTQRELHASQLRSQLAIESAGIGVWEWDAREDAGYYSQRTCEILDVDPKDLSSEGSWLACIHPDDRSRYMLLRKEHLEGSAAFHRAEIRVRQRDGSFRWVEDLGKVVERDVEGRAMRVVGTFLDIHHRKSMEVTLGRQAKEIADLVEHSPDGIIRYDREFCRLYANPAMNRFMGGIDIKSVIGEHLIKATHIHPQSYLSTLRHVFEAGEAAELEAKYISPEGAQCWLHARLTPEIDADGSVATALVCVRDVTENIRQREEIEQLAFSDPLTGLPNRARFNERFAGLLTTAKSAALSFTLLIIDLDNFKDVNDTLGHAAGDELLRNVTGRLSSELRHCDLLARLGGDEFAILLEDIADKQEVAEIATRLLSCVREEFKIGGQDMFVSASFGIACYPTDGTESCDLFARADVALYEAKANGRNNYQFFETTFLEKAESRLELGNALRTACARDEMELLYQPKIDLGTGEIVGAEALLRWHHPTLGHIIPCRFIPIAEENGTIVEIGNWVIRRAAQAAARWNGERDRFLKVAVNLSARQFVRNDLAGQIRAILEETNCRPEWIECEITESLLLEDSPDVQAILEALRGMGISIAIDDFGTGHSALACLSRFGIDVLKIDRSFVSRIGLQHKDTELVRAFVSIASALGMDAVAEGIENVEQAEILREMGCALGQGYYFGKPMSFEALNELPCAGRMDDSRRPNLRLLTSGVR
ncbi:EAL domain-containing protein [Agrobacterium sp. SHOUNA12C]|nr:EAL domain-containing protein [Agrobacterium sp. BETTINA12B]MCJ9757087.1 EAL domain-containing protein [Agrobacterium sp. SHOUNA12C]